MHDRRDKHRHEGHAVRLVTHDILYAIETDLVVVSEVGVDKDFQQVMD